MPPLTAGLIPGFFNRNTGQWQAIKIHVLCWMIFITYEVLVLYSLTGKLNPLQDYVFAYTLNIILFYAYGFFLLKRLSATTSFLLVTILYTGLFIAGYLVAKYVLTMALHFLGFFPKEQIGTLTVFVRNSIWRAVYFLGLSAGFALSVLTFRSRSRINALEKQQLQDRIDSQMLEKDLLQAENAFLKAQINPHFLFNTLNLIHNEVSRYSEEAGDLIISLAEIMRYAYLDPEPDGKISLALEINQIRNYITLNTQRFNQQLNLDFQVEGETEQVRIIPLVLMTIFENIFKYGDLTNPAYPAIVKLSAGTTQIIITTWNRKVRRSHTYSSGIGMSNLHKRLALAYPQRYELSAVEAEESYEMKLTILTPDHALLYH